MLLLTAAFALPIMVCALIVAGWIVNRCAERRARREIERRKEACARRVVTLIMGNSG